LDLNYGFEFRISCSPIPHFRLDKQETKKMKAGEANWNKGGEIDQFGEKALANELSRLLKPRDEIDRKRMEKAIGQAFFEEMGIERGKEGGPGNAVGNTPAGSTPAGNTVTPGRTPGQTPAQTPDSVNVAPGQIPGGKKQKGGADVGNNGNAQGNNGNTQGNNYTEGDVEVIEPSANARAQNFRKHFQQFIRPFQGLWAELEGGM
jgi:hypothetical protein